MGRCVALGADHGGYSMKIGLVSWLPDRGYQVQDLGAHSLQQEDDYPDYAEIVAGAVTRGEAERGILICGSGVGACIAANKVVGVRACLCQDTYSARQGVEDDDMNILCLGARVIGVELAKELVGAFLDARFSGEGRHRRRLQKVLDIERRSFPGQGAQAPGGTA